MSDPQIAAPLPDDVRISPQAECYVSEQRRFALTTQRELTLVLGLPHLSVLSAAELRVIIAHELAHFRGDTRLWEFSCIAFSSPCEPAISGRRSDAWRGSIPFFGIGRSIFISFVCLAAPIFRQQELHADAISASVHGGELTARTLLREWLLAHEFESVLETFRRPESRAARGPEPISRISVAASATLARPLTFICCSG